MINKHTGEGMFNENKYYKWYNNIIKTARERNVLVGYGENHHIIPRSMGGNDSIDNIVRLTAREHYVCHLLLPKFTSGNYYFKMMYALNFMCSMKREYQHRYHPTSRTYQRIREEFSKIHALNLTGRTLSTEHKEKISSSGKGRKDSPETIEKRRQSLIGKKRTKEQRIVMSNAQKTREQPVLTPEEEQLLFDFRSSVQLGKHSAPKSEDHKANLSRSLKGKTLGIKKSEETKTKMRKPKTESHRKAISDARKAKYAAIRNSQLSNTDD
jgi:hypothetical protein